MPKILLLIITIRQGPLRTPSLGRNVGQRTPARLLAQVRLIAVNGLW